MYGLVDAKLHTYETGYQDQASEAGGIELLLDGKTA